MVKKVSRMVLLAILIGVIVGAGIVLVRYFNDIAAARQRAASGSQIAQTACGPIEYAEYGQGLPILMIHGAGGGYDQGILLAQAFIRQGYRVIAPSRFGYLRAQRAEDPSDHSPTAQAKAHACLLDALGIDRAVIIGASAGGPSAIEFAQLYPDRTAGLILVSAVGKQEQPARETSDDTLRTILGSDFLYWAMVTGGQQQMIAMLGVKPEVQASLSPAELDWEREVLQAMLPITQRTQGILYDFHIDRTDIHLEQVAAPTLVIHAVDDTLVFYKENGQYDAQHIPGARLLTLPSGGHFLMGQHARVTQATSAFLQARPSTGDKWN